MGLDSCSLISLLIYHVRNKSSNAWYYLWPLQVLLSDGTQVRSSVVLSNATPYKTFMVILFNFHKLTFGKVVLAIYLIFLAGL